MIYRSIIQRLGRALLRRREASFTVRVNKNRNSWTPAPPLEKP